MDNNSPREDMENISPPKPVFVKGAAKATTEKDVIDLFETIFVSKSIAGAAAAFKKECSGGDAYKNNCAHYLSNAFIKVGYGELLPNNDCVNARCSTDAKRPIRARDMKCWFEHMATEKRSSIPKNEGFWAVFQLDESAYWGGHVVIIDTDKNKFYGTDNFPSWEQFAFKW